MKLASYAEGKWVESAGAEVSLLNAVNGNVVAETSTSQLDFARMLTYARTVGGPKLRRLTFHERAMMLKSLAKLLMEKKEEFYKLSAPTGATKTDSWIDIEGGIATFFTYSSKGRRELPNETFYIDGEMEPLSKEGMFIGRHICVPLEGVALHINAFNFPCWGMLEKLAPTFLAGVPAIVKPATSTSYLAQAMARVMIDSGILPEGSLQIICGGIGDLFDHLTGQDVVTFTGSAETGQRLRQHPRVVANSIRFNMEADSLNCSILGPDVSPGDEEFELFIKEVAREITVKAGQKCTAIRRTMVPKGLEAAVIDALRGRLARVVLGDPGLEEVKMGPLASLSQVDEVRKRVTELRRGAELVYGDPDNFEVKGGDRKKGAFFPVVLLHCKEPFKQSVVHDVEAFGPVSTIMPYSSVTDAVKLAGLGRGSLVASLFTKDNAVAREVVLGIAPYHGRLMITNRESAKESTGHGSPLPHLVHGGPGRAGGGEELGGVRSVLKYMQRTALQGSPTTLSAICGVWMKGASRREDIIHPFRKHFEELEVGDSLTTHRRTITEADVVNFACLSGDHFYAHTDEIAAKDSIFERRVAHGYFVLSAAAGLFVDPGFGPVLANYGLEGLRFTKPVYLGDTIQVKLTVKQKTPRLDKPEGVVAWDVEVTNQSNEVVAVYTILTLVKRRESSGA